MPGPTAALGCVSVYVCWCESSKQMRRRDSMRGPGAIPVARLDGMQMAA